MSGLDRLRGLAGGMRGRALEGVGLAEVRRLEERLERLEEAVAENALLATPLERHVADLERGLLPLLESPVSRRPG